MKINTIHFWLIIIGINIIILIIIIKKNELDDNNKDNI